MTRFLTLSSLCILTIALAACGGDTTDGGGSTTVDGSAAVMLTKDLGDAGSVNDAKAKEAGAEVAVFGRIAKLPGTYVAFTLTDDTLDYCGESCDGNCKTPWDYCCIPAEKVAAASIPVEMHDAKGNPVSALGLDLRLLDLVAVKGKLQKTESGGLMLVIKDGVFRRERPELPDHVVWPNP